jgi:hypothetical protein
VTEEPEETGEMKEDDSGVKNSLEKNDRTI